MPLQKIVLRPGLNREGTNYSNEGGYYDGDKIRFRSGFPEKIGGWIRFSAKTFLGVARSLWNWATLNGANYLGLGTNLKYYIEYSGDYYDITPITATATLDNVISTGYTTLVANLTANADTFTLTDGTYFPQNSGLVKINNEQIFYTQLVANVATGCVRGFNNTTAASHLANATVASAFLYVNDAAAPNAAINTQFINFANCTAVDEFSANLINQEHQAFKYTTGGFFFLGSTSDNNLSNVTFANAAVINGGGATINLSYQTEPGLAVYSIGTGWGAGPFNRGTWGSAFTSGGIGQQLRIWTNDNFGQDLIFAPRGGEIYYWEANLGLSVRGKKLEDLANVAVATSGQWVPKATNAIVSSAIQRFVIAFGANSYDPTDADTPFDPMLVRWSDQENPFAWEPAVTNQAGEFRLSNGSYIMDAAATRQEILVWTDAALYSMQYLGPPYIWGFQILMDNISIMSPNCAITVNNVTYWMGTDKFYVYSGRVETLPCALRQFVFEDINKDQSWQVTCGSNEGFNEVWWYYCSQNSNVIDRYIVYNYLDRVWYYGSLNRTAWLDSGIRQNPMATTRIGADFLGNPIGTAVYHELGNDDQTTASTLPIEAYVQSSDFDIGDGHNFGYVWRMIPDVNFNGSNVNQPSVVMELQPRQFSGSAYGTPANATTLSANNFTTFPQFTVQQYTEQVYTRVRARQMAFKISSDGVGVSWQLGAPRIDFKNDGRR
jgi:hypothetical protein